MTAWDYARVNRAYDRMLAQVCEVATSDLFDLMDEAGNAPGNIEASYDSWYLQACEELAGVGRQGEWAASVIAAEATAGALFAGHMALEGFRFSDLR